ncbi:substrate-binding domain-containing protein [Chitinivorax sp. B]|uniref:substrate-binding domain-containing protein n=1 Tax=Chitinivorax sp. B TaxID=2502235 RepID=UPI0010F47DB3|nr:substrate-binding domain-containing protein [Chitinivorax sp. B]
MRFNLLLGVLTMLLVLTSQPADAARPPLQAWDGPTTGPAAHPGKKLVIYIAQDYRNGGITGVYRAFTGAATSKLGWQVRAVDGKGEQQMVRVVFAQAIASKPDAIVLGGIPPSDLPDLIAQAQQLGIKLVGWHAGAKAGPSKELFFNVTTDALAVAQMAANYAIQNANGPMGAVIITDRRFDIAIAKSDAMKQIIEQCPNCRCLTVENVLISNAAEEVGGLVQRLHKSYGKAWTHTFAINDVYFDEMNFPLRQIKRPDIRNISAGDGSSKAINRIRGGLSQQVATIAEPLNAQGWQLADELNRAFSGLPPSGYVTSPVLVTREMLNVIGPRDIDSHLEYRQAYERIWFPARTTAQPANQMIFDN